LCFSEASGLSFVSAKISGWKPITKSAVERVLAAERNKKPAMFFPEGC